MLRTVVSLAAVVASVAQTDNIIQLAEKTPELSTLVAAVTAGGLVSALEGPGPFTVFAPVNRAFDALGRNILDFVLNPHNLKALDNVLTYHVASGAVLSKDLKDGQMIPTLDTESVTVHIAGGMVSINNAHVITADVLASNGVVHLVDAVLVPTNFALPKLDIVATAISVADLSTLVTAVVAANLTAALSSTDRGHTVFAPTNEAFAKLPVDTLNYLLAHPRELAEVILYHAVDRRVYAEQIKNFGSVRTLEGEELIFFVTPAGVSINGNATVIATNVDCSNGVVHLIDSVLIPKAVGARAAAWSAAAPTMNIVQLAQATPQLSTLVAAVVAANLVDTLSGTGPFTVMAPNDRAFAALPNGVLEYLLAHPAELVSLLTYHVVSGNVSSSQLFDGELVPSVNGANLTIHIVNTRVLVDDARVTIPDNFATNGVVHIIDRVLLPPATLAAATKAAATGAPLKVQFAASMVKAKAALRGA